MSTFVQYIQEWWCYSVSFADKFCQLCARRGKTPSSALKEMGLSPSALRRWKDPDNLPRSSTILLLADYFGVDHDRFAEWVESDADGRELELSKEPPEFHKPQDVTNPVGDQSISYLAQALRDPVISAYLEIISKCTPEQKEFLDDVLNKLDAANKKRNEKN